MACNRRRGADNRSGAVPLSIIFLVDDAANRQFDPVFNFALSRAVEAAFESIPQVILQSLALAELTASSPSMGQHVSIAWSIMNITFTFVSVNVSIDTNEEHRTMHPGLFGFVEKAKERAVSVALGLFELGCEYRRKPSARAPRDIVY